MPMARALIEANSDNIMWGTDWPHPNKYEVNPNDGDYETKNHGYQS